MASLSLRNIYRYIGGVTAVSDFSLEIEDKVYRPSWSLRLR